MFRPQEVSLIMTGMLIATLRGANIAIFRLTYGIGRLHSVRVVSLKSEHQDSTPTRAEGGVPVLMLFRTA